MTDVPVLHNVGLALQPHGAADQKVARVDRHPALARFAGDKSRRGAASEAMAPADVILFGLGRYGTFIAEGLHARGLKVLGIDFDPQMVSRWQARGLAAHYGDATDPDFGMALPLAEARWVVCAIPVHGGSLTHDDPRLTLVDALRAQGYQGRIAVAIQQPEDMRALYARDVDLILMPMADAAAEAVDLITGDMGGAEREQRERLLETSEA